MQGIKLFSDLPGNLSPTIISGDSFKLDPVILPSHCLYVLQLIIGYKSNLDANLIRKEKKYRQLILELRSQYKDVFVVNLSMGALGVISNSSNSFLDMMKDLSFDENTRKSIVRRLTNIAIRATYYIFRLRNKDWLNPELLTF